MIILWLIENVVKMAIAGIIPIGMAIAQMVCVGMAYGDRGNDFTSVHLS
jgi:hypothetical protein